MLCSTNVGAGVAVQMRVVLNAASLMGGVMFSVANVWGMNLWHGQIRLQEWPLWTFYLVRWLLVGSAFSGAFGRECLSALLSCMVSFHLLQG